MVTNGHAHLRPVSMSRRQRRRLRIWIVRALVLTALVLGIFFLGFVAGNARADARARATSITAIAVRVEAKLADVQRKAAKPRPVASPVQAPVQAVVAMATPTPVIRPYPAWPWGALADCESGLRDENDNPIPGSRRWDLNIGSFDGGLQFMPDTWRRAWKVAGKSGMGGFAYQHPAHVQIEVAAAWQAVTDWLSQWPACSRRLGLRP